MTQKWYAVYVDEDITPLAVFYNLEHATDFSKGKKAKIIEIPVSTNINAATTGKYGYSMTVYAPFNPWKKA